jgi:quercetin dioxygenase-like cupin family protein
VFSVESWDLNAIETPGGSRSPVVLHSDNDMRAVLIGLEPGQELGEHQVKENVLLVVVEGTAEIETGGGERLTAEAGTVVRFDPSERHSVSSADGARFLLVLAPWPAEGHYRDS